MSDHKTWAGDYDGGHAWVPVGYQRVPQWADDGGPVGKDSYRASTRLPDQTYIVRACRECPAVWIQEFDWSESLVEA